MKAWLVRVGKGWLPCDEIGEELRDRMAPGEMAEFRIVRPRSVRWHRLYFGVCRQIGENQDPPRDEDSIDTELRVLAGHFDVMHVQGHEVRVPKRIAFDKMSADEWAEYWRKVEPVIAERFGETYLPVTPSQGASERRGSYS